MNPVIGEGTQIALDMYRCLETVIQDPIQIETILKECMDRFSVKALHFYLDEDPDEGSLIFTVPVKGGHVILRVCEEFGYAGLDIMNMNGDFIPEELESLAQCLFSSKKLLAGTSLFCDMGKKDELFTLGY